MKNWQSIFLGNKTSTSFILDSFVTIPPCLILLLEWMFGDQIFILEIPGNCKDSIRLNQNSSVARSNAQLQHSLNYKLNLFYFRPSIRVKNGTWLTSFRLLSKAPRSLFEIYEIWGVVNVKATLECKRSLSQLIMPYFILTKKLPVCWI